jgi:hypothetical protein
MTEELRKQLLTPDTKELQKKVAADCSQRGTSEDAMEEHAYRQLLTMGNKNCRVRGKSLGVVRNSTQLCKIEKYEMTIILL